MGDEMTVEDAWKKIEVQYAYILTNLTPSEVENIKKGFFRFKEKLNMEEAVERFNEEWDNTV